MKIAIITFQETNNYGASLQNYALQQAILKSGHIVRTIDYRSKYIGKPFGLSHLRKKGLFSYLFGVMGYVIYLPRTKKCRRFRKNIFYTRPVKADSIEALNEEYDLFITGSDQVWNYKLTGSDTAYMLDFVKDKRKCNSYAASLGVSQIDPSVRSQYYELLKDYNIITVREESSVPLLKDILGRNIRSVSDPCLLLTAHEWSKVAAAPKSTGYIFVYQLGISSDIVLLARKIAKEKNLKLIFAPFPVGAFAMGKWDISAGNAEVLGYIKDADYVVTDSFHGTLLSMIFHKNFFTKVSGTHAGVSSRIYDLLKHYHLTDRIIQKDIDYSKNISYDQIQPMLDADRASSLQELKNILSAK